MARSKVYPPPARPCPAWLGRRAGLRGEFFDYFAGESGWRATPDAASRTSSPNSQINYLHLVNSWGIVDCEAPDNKTIKKQEDHMSYTSYMSYIPNARQERFWCLCALVVKVLSVLRLWKRCTVSVPDYAVQMYRKVPQSTAKRVKKFGPESVADCRKVIATMMIRKVDEAAKKRFAGNAPQNPAFEIVR